MYENSYHSIVEMEFFDILKLLVGWLLLNFHVSFVMFIKFGFGVEQFLIFSFGLFFG